MIKTVFVLCLFMMPGNQLLEHRYQSDLPTCLKMKREAIRNTQSDTVDFRCGQVKAEIETNIDGSLSIKRILKPKN
jgi:hypothetical protein